VPGDLWGTVDAVLGGDFDDADRGGRFRCRRGRAGVDVGEVRSRFVVGVEALDDGVGYCCAAW
jgi:hypothetical protein